jgi:hypothetical protein
MQRTVGGQQEDSWRTARGQLKDSWRLIKYPRTSSLYSTTLRITAFTH